METVYEIFDRFMDSSISLESLGIKQRAWKWENISNILNYLEEQNCAILGGDVYKLHNGIKERTYDNWYIDKDHTISWGEYIKKSIHKTFEYIEKYYLNNGDEYCYSLVIAHDSEKL
jgi:hypothetical protein